MALQKRSNQLQYFSKTLDPSPIRHIGTRYNTNGVFLPEPGNTVVCHLAKNSLSEQAVVGARLRMQSLPEAENLTFTEVSSLHMTLFQGIIEHRRRLPYWPDMVALDTPIDEMTALYMRRLESFQAPPSFKVAVIGATPNGLKVDGLTAHDRDVMRGWRDQLSEVFGYRHPDHETYEYHITFAYLLDRFSDDAIMVWQKGLAEIVENLQEYAPIIELEPPAFCSFNDMNHFEKLLILK